MDKMLVLEYIDGHGSQNRIFYSGTVDKYLITGISEDDFYAGIGDIHDLIKTLSNLGFVKVVKVNSEFTNKIMLAARQAVCNGFVEALPVYAKLANKLYKDTILLNSEISAICKLYVVLGLDCYTIPYIDNRNGVAKVYDGNRNKHTLLSTAFKDIMKKCPSMRDLLIVGGMNIGEIISLATVLDRIGVEYEIL